MISGTFANHDTLERNNGHNAGAWFDHSTDSLGNRCDGDLLDLGTSIPGPGIASFEGLVHARNSHESGAIGHYGRDGQVMD